MYVSNQQRERKYRIERDTEKNIDDNTQRRLYINLANERNDDLQATKLAELANRVISRVSVPTTFKKDVIKETIPVDNSGLVKEISSLMTDYIKVGQLDTYMKHLESKMTSNLSSIERVIQRTLADDEFKSSVNQKLASLIESGEIAPTKITDTILDAMANSKIFKSSIVLPPADAKAVITETIPKLEEKSDVPTIDETSYVPSMSKKEKRKAKEKESAKRVIEQAQATKPTTPIATTKSNKAKAKAYSETHGVKLSAIDTKFDDVPMGFPVIKTPESVHSSRESSPRTKEYMQNLAEQTKSASPNESPSLFGRIITGVKKVYAAPLLPETPLELGQIETADYRLEESEDESVRAKPLSKQDLSKKPQQNDPNKLETSPSDLNVKDREKIFNEQVNKLDGVSDIRKRSKFDMRYPLATKPKFPRFLVADYVMPFKTINDVTKFYRVIFPAKYTGEPTNDQKQIIKYLKEKGIPPELFLRTIRHHATVKKMGFDSTRRDAIISTITNLAESLQQSDTRKYKPIHGAIDKKFDVDSIDLPFAIPSE